MQKIQVIGLPGSGKSTQIAKFRNFKPDVQLLDIRLFNGGRRDRLFKQAIVRTERDLIAESACGVYVKGSIVVHLKTPMRRVYAQLFKRDGYVDEDYLSLLSTQLIPAQYTIDVPAELPELLSLLMEK